MQLSTRITLAIVGVLACALASSVVVVGAMDRIGRMMQLTLEENINSVSAAARLEIALLEQRGMVSSYVLDGGKGNWIDDLDKENEEFESLLATIRDASRTPQEREILSRLENVFHDYDRRRDEAVRLFESGEVEAAKKLLLGEVRRLSNEASALCEEYIKANQDIVSKRTESVKREIRGATQRVIFFAVVTALVGSLLLWLFLRGVLVPLRRMAAEARLVAPKDNATHPTPVDELHEVGAYLRLLMTDIADVRSHLEDSRAALAKSESLASVGRLAAGVAHEIRNPLSAIKMWLFSIQKSLGDKPELQRKVDIVSAEVSRLEQIIVHFIQFARPPQPTIRRERLAPVIEQSHQLLRHLFDEKNVACEFAVDADLSEVYADREQLGQVLVNLIKNAIEAVPDGGKVTISTNTSSTGDGQAMAVIRVEDNGSGIADEARQRIFDPFFTTKNNGTGLGLCISVRIMENHNGRLVLERSNSNGTAFAIWVPFADGKA